MGYMKELLYKYKTKQPLTPEEWDYILEWERKVREAEKHDPYHN